MSSHPLHLWEHDHSFGQERIRSGERRTLLVIAITATMMIIEIIAGVTYGSIALLADGLHMGTHALALGITAFAYFYARKYAHDQSFSYGTGKVNALAGFSSAILLLMFALVMAWESMNRFFNPVEIIFNQAIAVAIIGLIVNAASVFILGRHDHEEDHHHHHDHDHDHANHAHQADHHSDHNLRAAYLHVLADALTSLLAIFALSAGKFLGFVWMDPFMGIVGAVLVTVWAWGLLRDTSRVLLDKQAPLTLQNVAKKAIEEEGDNHVVDLHLWAIGPDIYAAAISILTDRPKPIEHYKKLLPEGIGLVHSTIEVHQGKQPV